MPGPIRDAVILGGGKGERLRPLTDSRPKPMLEVLGVPIVAYQLRWLREAGVERVVISCGYKAEVFQQQLGDGRGFGLEISYAIEETPLGRGGGMRFAALKLPEQCQAFYATNGDVLTNIDLPSLEERRHERRAPAAIAVVPFESPFGVVELSPDEALVRAFREKVRLPHWLNAGVYALGREVIEMLPEVGDHEDSTFPDLAHGHRLAALPATEAYWRSIDSMKDLKLAAEEIPERLPAAWRQPLAAVG